MKRVALDLDGVISKSFFHPPAELMTLVEKIFYVLLSWPYLHKALNVFRRPNTAILKVIHYLIAQGWEVVILSANPVTSEMALRGWLKKIGLPNIRLILNDQPEISVRLWKWNILKHLDAILIDDNPKTVCYINRYSKRIRAFHYRRQNATAILGLIEGC